LRKLKGAGKPAMPSKRNSGPNWFDRTRLKVKSWLGMHTILCDSCKWDWRGACHRPERPNAVWCPDYEKRG
jgi:hypothetical protein